MGRSLFDDLDVCANACPVELQQPPCQLSEVISRSPDRQLAGTLKYVRHL